MTPLIFKSQCARYWVAKLNPFRCIGATPKDAYDKVMFWKHDVGVKRT
jgi:hypothetical protein